MGGSMSSVIITGDTSGAITLAAPTVAGTNTITLPANTGTVITTASTFGATGPAFSAYKSSNQTLTNSTLTKITFDTEVFDTNNNFASSTFTPTVAGYYQISCMVNANDAVTGTVSATGIYFYRNGARYYDGLFLPTASKLTSSVVIYLNGSTDYVEIYAYITTTGTAAVYGGSGPPQSYFQGFLARAA
jgi:hypothetical protein